MPRPSRKAQPKYGFFNLPSDEAMGYPRFSSFEQRENYIRSTVPKECLDLFNQLVAAARENQATKNLEEIGEVEEYSDMEHSQRFLDDTKRFKALMKATNKQYQDEQDCNNMIEFNIEPLSQGPQEPMGGTTKDLGPKTTSITHENLKTIDNNVVSGGLQVPLSPKSSLDPLNCNSPNQSPSTSSERQEPQTNQWSNQDNCGTTSSRSSTLREKSFTSTSKGKRQNKYLMHCQDQKTFQQLPLKSLPHPKKKLKLSSSPIMELHDHLKLLQTVFVGETTSHFVPMRGDLIVVHPDRGKELTCKGYLTSYGGPNTHKFEHGELVVRIGYFVQVEQRKYLHQPYKSLELYSYNREGDWRYLGRESEMIDTHIPIDDSPGKHLQVGSPVTSSCHCNFITPRRGDVIIKGAAWVENFSHRDNFRRSMVKWHKEKPVKWEPEDMLLRLFVDKQMDDNTPPFVYSKPIPPPDPGEHSDCVPHGPCEEVHTPPAPGFAELYRIEGLESRDMGWVFWGRTKHTYDTPYLKIDPLYLRLYTFDEDEESDPDSELHRPMA